jgi:hypothetical protein
VYYHFDAYDSYIEYTTTSFLALESELQFGIYANTIADYASFPARWATFVDTELNSPYDMDIYSISLYTEVSYFDCLEVAFHQTHNCSQIFEHTFTCNDSAVTNVMAYRMKESIDFRLLCNGLVWGYNDSILAVNVDNSTEATYNARCTAEPGKGVIPATVSCQQNVEDTNQFNVTKFSAVLTMRQEVVVAPDVPRISGLSVSPSNTNATVVINATCVAPYCTFYCGALPANDTLTSARAMISIGTALITATNNTNYQHYSLHTVVTPNKLIPGDYYDVYCFAEDAVANPASLAMVKATKVTVLTQCCKPIFWTNSPSYIYADESKYSSSAASSYTFTYSLIEAPDDDLTVSYILYKLTGSTGGSANYDLSTDANNTVATISANPSSETFTSASVSSPDTGYVSGSLTITCDFVDTSGCFTVVPVLSGTNAAQFFASSAVFQLLSSYEEPIAPVLTSADFSSNGISITIRFDSETDYGSTSSRTALAESASVSPWACDLLFTFDGASDSACAWLTSSLVRATFSTSANIDTSAFIVPGGVVTLVADQVKAACGEGVSDCGSYAYAASSSVTSEASSSPDSPVIIWNVPLVLGNCDNLTLDATGSYGNGGRPWASIAFSVTAQSNEGHNIDGDSTVSDIDSLYLSSLNSTERTVLIPGRYMNTSFTYYFKLQLQNYYGSTSTSTVEILRDTSASIPSVSVVGSNDRVMTVNKPLSLMVRGAVSSCSDEVSLSYKWYVYEDTVYKSTITSRSIDRRRMVLDAYALSVGSSYRFTSIVTTDAGMKANTSVDVRVVNGIIVPVISGGSTRVIPIDRSFAIDGSSSYDEDVSLAAYSADMSTYPLSYSWACTYGSLESYGSSCDSDVFGTGATQTARIVTVPANSLTFNETYLFTLTCSAGNRSASAYVTVKAVAGGSPEVSITDYSYSTGATAKFSSRDRVTLSALVEAASATRSTWSVSPSLADSLDELGMIPAIKTITASQAASGYTQRFAISGSHFLPGVTYTFRLTSSLTASGTNSYAEIALTANSAPTVGTVGVSPSAGAALTTTFTIFATNFVDDAEDLPLLYRFSYVKAPEVYKYSDLNTFTERSYYSTSLPMGYPAFDYEIVCTAVVMDVHGAKSNGSASAVRVESIVTVTSTDDGGGTDATLTADAVTTITDTLETSMTANLASGDADAAQQVIAVVSDILNGAVDCSGALSADECNSTYHRRGCFNEPHTCGECIDGYFGISGSSNTRCRKESSAGRRRLLAIADEADYFARYSFCSSDEDCGWGSCVSSTDSTGATSNSCSPFYKSCPSGPDPAKTCSGNGQCVFMEAGALPVTECLATNAYCTATCSCFDGYAGSDCGSTTSEYEATESIRETLCVALSNNSAQQDLDSDMLDSAALSLADILKPEEIRSRGAIDTCLATLAAVNEIAGDGYLAGSTSAAESLVEAVSDLVDVARRSEVSTLYGYWDEVYQNQTDGASGGASRRRRRRRRRRRLDTGEEEESLWEWDAAPFEQYYGKFRHHVDSDNSAFTYMGLNSTITKVVANIIKDMLPGEEARNFVSDNIRLTIIYPDIADLPNLTLSVPQSSDDILYDTPAPTLTMPRTGLDACQISNSDYIQLSFLAWGFAPYSHSDRLRSPLVRYSASLPSGASSDPLPFNGTDHGHSYDPQNAIEHTSYGVDPAVKCVGHSCFGNEDSAYTLMLPFFDRTDWGSTVTLPRGTDYPGTRNTTVPSCAIRNGYSSYDLCHTQNGTTYTPYNVTYLMPDVSSLCPLTGVTSSIGATDNARRLGDGIGGQGKGRLTELRRTEDRRQESNELVYTYSDYVVDRLQSLPHSTSRSRDQKQVGDAQRNPAKARMRGLAVTVADETDSIGTSIVEMGAMFDLITTKIYALTPYGPSISVVSVFASLCFLFVALALLIFRWDYVDQWRVRTYLHRDMLRQGKSDTISLFVHINAIVDSVGIKDDMGEDYRGDSDEEEFDDWKDRQNLLRLQSAQANGAAGAAALKGKDALGLDVDWDEDEGRDRAQAQKEGQLALALLDDESDDDSEEGDGALVGRRERVEGAEKKGMKRERVERGLGNAKPPLTLSEGLSLSLDDNDSDSEEEKEGHEDISIQGDDRVNVIVTAGDHFSSYYREKVDCFLKQALHLTGSVYQSRRRDGYFDPKVLTSALPLHEYTKMFSNFRTFIHSRTHDYLLACSRVLMMLIMVTLFYDVIFPADYSCESRVNSGDASTDGTYLLANQSRREKCMLGQPIVMQNIYPAFPSECDWHEPTETCLRRPPPDQWLYYLLVGLAITVASSVPDQLLQYTIKLCNKRPRLEDIGFDSVFWLGERPGTIPSSKAPTASTIIGSMLGEVRATILLDKSGNRPPRRIILQETLEETERAAIEFVKGEENSKILEESSSIAEVMRKMKQKMRELEAEEAASSTAPSPDRAAAGAAGSGGAGSPLSPSGVSDMSSEPFTSPSAGKHTLNDGAKGRGRGDEDDDDERLMNLDEAAARLVEASSVMKARYQYVDCLPVQDEMHILLEKLRTEYEQSVSGTETLAEERRIAKEKEEARAKAHVFGVIRNRARQLERESRGKGDEDEDEETKEDPSLDHGRGSDDHKDKGLDIPASELPAVARFGAILEEMDVQFDGQPRRLILWESITTSSDPKLRLHAQLVRARERAQWVLSDVLAYQGKSSIHDDISDMKLLQELCVEQFPPSMRFALHRVFTNAADEVKALSSDSTMHSTPLRLWLLAWAAFSLFWAGGVYYVFAWAITNNLVAVRAWLSTAAIVILSDLFVYKTCEVLFIHFMVFDRVKPRLKKVAATLREIMYTKFKGAQVCQGYCDPARTPGNREDMNSGVGANQQLSSLSSSGMDIRAVQHLSGACRAARSSQLSHLPAAQLLMRLDDVDVHMLRWAARGYQQTTPGALSTFMTVFFYSLSPRLQESLYHFFTVITIPVVWTGLVLGCYYLAVSQPLVYIYLCAIALVYLTVNGLVVYPAKQRMRGVIRAMDQDQREGKSALTLAEHRKRYNVGATDQLLISLGLIHDPLAMLPTVKKQRFILKMFSRVWGMRVHGGWAGDKGSGDSGGGSHDVDSISDDEGSEVASSMVSLPPSERLRALREAYQRSLHLAPHTAPDFMALQRFTDAWEAKWHVGRDYLLRSNQSILEQYVGGDPDELLHLHLQHVQKKSREVPDDVALALSQANAANLFRSPRERVEVVQSRVKAELGLEKTHLRRSWARRLKFWSRSKGADEGKKAPAGEALTTKAGRGGVGASIDATNAALARAQQIAKDDANDLVHELLRQGNLHSRHSSAASADLSPPSSRGDHGFIKRVFTELGGAGTAATTGRLEGSGLLAYPHLLQVCYRVFKHFTVDGSYLSESEWADMATHLLLDLAEYPEECMTYDELLVWLRSLVVRVREDRVKGFRRVREKARPPPEIAPVPLGLPARAAHASQANETLLRTLLQEPTQVPLEGWRRIKTKFMELDPLDMGLVGVTDAMFIAEWVWGLYQPCGIAVDSEEKREAQQELYSAMRGKLSVDQVVDAEGYYSTAACIELSLLYSWFKHVDAKMRLRRMKNTSSAQLVRMDRDMVVRPSPGVVSTTAAVERGRGKTRRRGGISTLDWLLGRSKGSVNPSLSLSTDLGARADAKGAIMPLGDTAMKPLRSAHLPIPGRSPFPLSPLSRPGYDETKAEKQRKVAHSVYARTHHRGTRGISSARLFNPNSQPSVLLSLRPIPAIGSSTAPADSSGSGGDVSKPLRQSAPPTRSRVRYLSQVRLSDLHRDGDEEDLSTAGEDDGTQSTAMDDDSASTNPPREAAHVPWSEAEAELYTATGAGAGVGAMAVGGGGPAPSATTGRSPTRLSIPIDALDESSDSASASGSSKGASETLTRDEDDYHHWVGRKNKDLSLLPAIAAGADAEAETGREMEEDMAEEDEETVPVAHGMYFDGGLLEPPKPPPKQHTRKSFLHVHLGDSDTESSNSSSGDSASSGEEVDRRQPYYQIYKLDKRERRLQIEANMHIRKARAEERGQQQTAFRIPPSLVLDPMGRPKTSSSFTTPAFSPPRNPRVTLGLHRSPTKRKINRMSRMRDSDTSTALAALGAPGVRPAAPTTGGGRRRPPSHRGFNDARDRTTGGALHIPLDVDYSLSSDSDDASGAGGHVATQQRLGLAHSIASEDSDAEGENEGEEEEEEEEQTVRAISAAFLGSPQHPSPFTSREVVRSSPLNYKDKRD